MSELMSERLRRELGLMGAVLLGLGAMVGTGVFVSVGLGAGLAGPGVIVAVALAAAVATCNALSSAQLAASHPVSGGTYEYGYRYLTPWLGFVAGWMFLIAKSASAATAALGFAGYTRTMFDLSVGLLIPLALLAVVVLTAIVLSGLRRSNLTNAVIVSITLLALAVFVLVGSATAPELQDLEPFFVAGGAHRSTLGALFHASALMFVAYTGYGRIATLGEEVHEPEHTIPRAIIIVMAITLVLYTAVAFVGVSTVGADALAEAARTTAAPLAAAIDRFGPPWAAPVLVLGAVTAMLGVLLNLILGLSRVLLAMGRRGDMPRATGRLNADRTTPVTAVLIVGAAIAALVLVGDIQTTWTFSAFTVLIYYALTNLAALRLPAEQRRYPRLLAVFGLAGCLFLAFWVEREVWLIGLGLIVLGLLWQLVGRRLWRPADLQGGT